MTDDFGATWTSIAGNLPNEPINVVFEDAKNPNLLFVGNDTGVFVSIDRGARWVKMNNNMPNMPVHDLLVHPREHDLILGTYGRDFWITNIAPLQELNDGGARGGRASLFSIKPTMQRVTWSFGANDYLFGQRHLQTPNEPNGMVIRYYLKGARVRASDRRRDGCERQGGRAAAGPGQRRASTPSSGTCAAAGAADGAPAAGARRRWRRAAARRRQPARSAGAARRRTR